MRMQISFHVKMTFCALFMVQFLELDEWETEVHSYQRLYHIVQDLIQHSQSHPATLLLIHFC